MLKQVKKMSINNDNDNVNNPKHYNKFAKETIEIIEFSLTLKQFQGYLIGNILKYRLRAGYKKNRKEDLKKSNWYQDYLNDFNKKIETKKQKTENKITPQTENCFSIGK
jgi:hypothetical protein